MMKVIIYKPCFGRVGVHKNLHSYTRMKRETICVKVHSFRILPFRGNNCGLIPIRSSFCSEIKKGVCNPPVAS